jgi:hypothetical protein
MCACVYLGTRWNRRRGRPRWPGLTVDEETERMRSLPREVRRAADRAIRRGEAVHEPEFAVIVCQRARIRRRTDENPWIAASQFFNMLMLACVMCGQVVLGTLSHGFLWLPAAFLAVAALVQLYRWWILRRTAIAVELNLPLAEKAREETSG